MSRKAPEVAQCEPDQREGLFLVGTVLGRSARVIGEGEKKTEVVTYRILASGSVHNVDSFAGRDHAICVGEVVRLPVFVNAFRRRDGTTSVTLRIEGEGDGRGPVSF